MHENIDFPVNHMRLDKWLWCSRFYKTRTLAANAIKGGKVHVNDERAKPAKLIHIGDKVNIRLGSFRFDITILALVTTRKSATLAALLYKESKESIAEREKLAIQMKVDAAIFSGLKGRPTKRSRRELIRFKANK